MRATISWFLVVGLKIISLFVNSILSYSKVNPGENTTYALNSMSTPKIHKESWSHYPITG